MNTKKLISKVFLILILVSILISAGCSIPVCCGPEQLEQPARHELEKTPTKS